MAAAQRMEDTTPENLRKFFDETTYSGKTVGLPPLGPTKTISGVKRDQLRSFFDPSSYCSQKRSAAAATVHPSAKARTGLGKADLVAKFKLAAELNGFDFAELMVPHLTNSVAELLNF